MNRLSIPHYTTACCANDYCFPDNVIGDLLCTRLLLSLQTHHLLTLMLLLNQPLLHDSPPCISHLCILTASSRISIRLHNRSVSSPMRISHLSPKTRRWRLKKQQRGRVQHLRGNSWWKEFSTSASRLGEDSAAGKTVLAKTRQDLEMGDVQR